MDKIDKAEISSKRSWRKTKQKEKKKHQNGKAFGSVYKLKPAIIE